MKLAIIGTARGFWGLAGAYDYNFAGTGTQPVVVSTPELRRTIGATSLLGPAELLDAL